MELLDKLKDLRNTILHKTRMRRVFRFHYLSLKNVNGQNDGVTELVCNKFMSPLGMDEDDSFIVLSYLYDKFGKVLGSNVSDFWRVHVLNQVMFAYGFVKINDQINSDRISELYVLEGDVEKHMKLKNNTFWYTPDVSLDIVRDIYGEMGEIFKDLDSVDKSYLKLKSKEKK